MTNNKYKIIIYATALLLIANMVFTTLLWQKSSHDPHEDASFRHRGRFLVDNIGFDSTQKIQLDYLMEQHFNQVDILKNKEREIKKSLFELLKSTTFDSVVVWEKINEAAQIKAQLDSAVFYHVKRVRNICNASQLAKLDSNIENLLLPPPPPNFQGAVKGSNEQPEDLDREIHGRSFSEKNKRQLRTFPGTDCNRENHPRSLEHSEDRAFDDKRPDGPPPPRHRFDHPPGRPPGPPQGPPTEAF